ncbi:MAG: DUF6055 domain-containing protein [Bacteroidales bacterium]|nr:DUF6055 domain-containing protein [Bacteroidales bacterium]
MRKIVIIGLLALYAGICAGQENIALEADTVSTSHVSSWETLGAINDGFDPASSTDKSNGAYGNWVGTEIGTENWDWVQYSWDSLYVIDKSAIYWWTDGGGIQIPDESYIHYRDIKTGQWVEVKNHSGFVNNVNEYNVVTFDPVLTNAIRYHMVSHTQATGILEWKVYGRIGEQQLYNSTVDVSPGLSEGVTSTFTVTALDANNDPRSGYTFKVLAETTNRLTGSGWNDEVYNVNGQLITDGQMSLDLSPTGVDGKTTFEVVMPGVIDPTDGINITIQYNDGVVALATESYYASSRVSPVLTADETDNTIDHDIEITFTDNSSWRDDIECVLVNGIKIAPGSDYGLLPGVLVLKPSGGSSSLTTSGEKSVVVQALGFSDAEVTQVVDAGQVFPEGSIVAPLVNLYKGVSTQLQIVVQDRFGNALQGYELAYDIDVINDDVTTAEEYVLDGTAVTSDLTDQVAPATDVNGQSLIEIALPDEIDFNDGILIAVKLQDGSLLDEVGYKDASITTSLISGKNVGEIAIAGRLYTEIHSLFMVARNENGTVLNWYNLGFSGGGPHNSVGGNFGNFGLDVPWNERDQHYPIFDTVAAYPVVQFRGNNFIKGNYPAETDITGTNSFTVELWVYDENPAEGETILGWQAEDGSSASAPLTWPAGVTGTDQWRHLVVSCDTETETWYLDGTEIFSRAREMEITAGHRLVLGGASENEPLFEGSLLTVRVHKENVTPEQVAHNYHGGGMLGTDLRFNLDPNVRPEEGYHYDTWSEADPEDYYFGVSEHFDHRVLLSRIQNMTENDRNAFYERIPGMFETAEDCYHMYSEVHALRMPIVSTIPQYRGDGIKYRIKIGTTDGANYMGWHGALGFGYAMQFPGHINPHEFVHGTQAQTGSGMQGNYWEVHANWPQTYLGLYQTVPAFVEFRDQNLFEASGRSYYHARLMFQHLAETPEYGPMFISNFWYNGGTDAYPWLTFKHTDPDPTTSLGYEWARMVQRNITWDYTIHEPVHAEDYYNPDLYRDDVKNNYWQALSQGFILLEDIIDMPGWYRAPKGKITQQTGWNILPLHAEGNQVTVELDGYIDNERGSAWYGGFVAVNDEGNSRYSEIIRNGESLTFELLPDETELYFTVVAIPDHILAIDMVGDVRKIEQDPFPYKIRFEGAEPYDKMAAYHKEKYKDVAGSSHTNGGGFVDNRATVASTAYVGPNAYVIGNSNVLDTVRIEDHAVIENSTISGQAIVSGHAVIESNSKVKDYARVRDFSRINGGSTLSEYAKIAEHALLESGNTNKGHTTLKGIAIKYGDGASGTAMMDHHFAKGQTITKGKWFTWSWGSGKNTGEADVDYEGLYMRMTFEEEHPYMAWDDFGITWGYLGNGAGTVDESVYGRVLSLNGVDQFVELQNDVSDQVHMSLIFDVKWNGGSHGQPVFYFSNAAENSIFFTPSDESGNAALVMNYNGNEERIIAAEGLPENEWVNISIYFGEKGAKLFLNEELAGENEHILIRNLTIGAGRFYNFLGRDMEGSSFYDGMIDNFMIYNTDNYEEETTGKVAAVPSSDFVKIFPNPVVESLKIELLSANHATIAIVDMNGRELFSSAFKDHTEISKSDFGAAGIYSVIIREGGRTHMGTTIIN